jgi:hypothetical protein
MSKSKKFFEDLPELKYEKALKKLLDYCQPDEERHYEECVGTDGKTKSRKHIVHTIRFLRKWIESSEYDHELMEA